MSAAEVTPDASIALTAVSLAAAAVAAAAIIVTLGRVGWLKTWGQRAVSLPLAIAALVVALAHPRPHAGESPRPSVTRAPVSLSDLRRRLEWLLSRSRHARHWVLITAFPPRPL